MALANYEVNLYAHPHLYGLLRYVQMNTKKRSVKIGLGSTERGIQYSAAGTYRLYGEDKKEVQALQNAAAIDFTVSIAKHPYEWNVNAKEVHHFCVGIRIVQPVLDVYKQSVIEKTLPAPENWPCLVVARRILFTSDPVSVLQELHLHAQAACERCALAEPTIYYDISGCRQDVERCKLSVPEEEALRIREQQDKKKIEDTEEARKQQSKQWTEMRTKTKKTKQPVNTDDAEIVTLSDDDNDKEMDDEEVEELAKQTAAVTVSSDDEEDTKWKLETPTLSIQCLVKLQTDADNNRFTAELQDWQRHQAPTLRHHTAYTMRLLNGFRQSERGAVETALIQYYADYYFDSGKVGVAGFSAELKSVLATWCFGSGRPMFEWMDVKYADQVRDHFLGKNDENLARVKHEFGTKFFASGSVEIANVPQEVKHKYAAEFRSAFHKNYVEPLFQMSVNRIPNAIRFAFETDYFTMGTVDIARILYPDGKALKESDYFDPPKGDTVALHVLDASMKNDWFLLVSNKIKQVQSYTAIAEDVQFSGLSQTVVLPLVAHDMQALFWRLHAKVKQCPHLLLEGKYMPEVVLSSWEVPADKPVELRNVQQFTGRNVILYGFHVV